VRGRVKKKIWMADRLSALLIMSINITNLLIDFRKKER